MGIVILLLLLLLFFYVNKKRRENKEEEVKIEEEIVSTVEKETPVEDNPTTEEEEKKEETAPIKAETVKVKKKEDLSISGDFKDYPFLSQNFSEGGLNFVALDFETATTDRNSICEVGLAIVKNGQIVETKDWLIQPPHNKYDDFIKDIHGITPEVTKDCPSFLDVWEEILPYIEGHLVVAHNTAFDMYALRGALYNYNIKFPSFINMCSMRLSRAVVRAKTHKLSSLCERFNIEYGTKHRADADAVACAKVAIKLIELSKYKNFKELSRGIGFRFGRFAEKYFRPQKSY